MSFTALSRRCLVLLFGLVLAVGSAMAVTLDEAVEQVRDDTKGQVLSAQTVTVAGRRIHRIKVLMPDGRVRIVQVPAGKS